MIILLTIVHIILCVFLVVVVLLQSGKAADLAGAFGGMGSQTAFGPRGSTTVLSKATTIAAALFMVSSLTLAIMASRGAGTASSVTERSRPASKAASKATTAPTPGPAKPMTVTPTDQNGRPLSPPQQIPVQQPGSSNQVQSQPTVPPAPAAQPKK